jgi:hypothetical protein
VFEKQLPAKPAENFPQSGTDVFKGRSFTNPAVILDYVRAVYCPASFGGGNEGKLVEL